MSKAIGKKAKEFILYSETIILVKIDTKSNPIQL